MLEATWVKGMRKYKPAVRKQISHADVTYSMGNIFHTIVLTLSGDRW